MLIQQFKDLSPLVSRNSLLSYAFQQSKHKGHILEFGVYKGDSINFLAKLSDGHVTGFDSFEGLPEDWKRSDNSVYKKGHFHLKGTFPPVEENVTLVKGFFEDSLKLWMAMQATKTASFIHIDCDLYGGCLYVLETLNDWIVPGTIIVFDELANFGNGVYKDWKDGEWRALNEWEETYKRTLKPIGRTNTYQAAIQVE